jgi:hypothetical protein
MLFAVIKKRRHDMKRWSSVTGPLVISFFLLLNAKTASADTCANADEVLNKLLSDQRIQTMVDDAYLAGYVVDEILPQIVDLAYDLGYDPDELILLVATCWTNQECTDYGCCASSTANDMCASRCYGACNRCN